MNDEPARYDDAEDSDSPRRGNAIDTHVGKRMRLRRMLVGMSQEKLGDLMGLTFQQIQKYEKGVNRIGASRLFRLSQVLNVPVQFFYDDLPTASDATHMPGFAEPDPQNLILEFLNTREGLELNRHFIRIKDPIVRRSIVEFVRSLSDQSASVDTGSEG